MADSKRVEVSFINSYPGQFPGQPGALTKTYLRLNDIDGKIIAAERQLCKILFRERAIRDRSNSRGWLNQLFWTCVREFYIEFKFKAAILQALKRDPQDADLEMAWLSTTEGFDYVESKGKARELRENFKKATDFWVYEC